MGGDEVVAKCWDVKPEIKQYMKERNITDYVGLESYLRKTQAALLSKSKRAMYWFNAGVKDLSFRKSDILQFWDYEQYYDILKKVENDIVITTKSYLYFDYGIGAPSHYSTWYQIYQFDPRKAGIGNRTLGASAALWSERISPNTLDSVVWPRTTSLGLRLWNVEEKLDKLQLAQKVIAMN